MSRGLQVLGVVTEVKEWAEGMLLMIAEVLECSDIFTRKLLFRAAFKILVIDDALGCP